MVGGVLLLRHHGMGLDVQAAEQRLHFALEGEEVLIFAIGTQGQDDVLLGQVFALHRQINLCQLIELCSLIPVGIVPC